MAHKAANQIEFVLSDSRPQLAQKFEPFDWWGSPGTPQRVSFYRLKDSYLIRVSGQADFVINLARLLVRCHPVPDAFGTDCESLYRNTILPLIANYLGELHLHASAIVAFDKAFAFSGVSGTGKSTIATVLARGGHPYLTDDALPLEKQGSGYQACPGHSEIRLCNDSLSAVDLNHDMSLVRRSGIKTAVKENPLVPHQATPVPLGAIHFLGDGSSPELAISRLAPAVAATRLLEHSFVLDVENRDRLQAHFERLARLAEFVPCFALDYPRCFAQMPLVIPKLVSHLERLGGSHETA